MLIQHDATLDILAVFGRCILLSNSKHYNHYNNNHNINNTDIMFRHLVLINIELPTVNNILWCCVEVVLLL